MKNSRLGALAGLFMMVAAQTLSIPSQAYQEKKAVIESLPSDLKIQCTIGNSSDGHGGQTGFEDEITIDFTKIKSGYEKTGLVVKTTSFNFGQTSEVGYRVLSRENLGGNLYFVSGQSDGLQTISFLLQRLEGSYRLIKINKNAYWGDELYSGNCINQ